MNKKLFVCSLAHTREAGQGRARGRQTRIANGDTTMKSRLSLAGVAPALILSTLAGCGAEVAGTAATVAATQAAQASQAQAQQAKIVEGFKQAQAGAADRAASAADEAGK
jgi:hypothetical protein